MKLLLPNELMRGSRLRLMGIAGDVDDITGYIVLTRPVRSGMVRLRGLHLRFMGSAVLFCRAGIFVARAARKSHRLSRLAQPVGQHTKAWKFDDLNFFDRADRHQLFQGHSWWLAIEV